jgi:hypothetical protein
LSYWLSNLHQRKNGLKTPSEAILLFGLSTAERAVIKGLISPFQIKAVDLSINTIGNFIQEFPEKKICLIVLHIDERLQKQIHIIREIRNIVGHQVPFLVLIPPQKISETSKYLRAGADDYMELPLNENRFSVGFLILLELGQTIARTRKRDVKNERENTYGWNRIVNYFQEGLSYFAPKSLIQRKRSENISDKWQQVKKLGHGGFGVVWLVKEIGTERLAVAKTPHSSRMNVRVLRSAAILKRLVHHPNIVQLIEIARNHGKLILIQEYVEGPTLQQLLEVGMTPLDKEDYFLQLLSAIVYSHQYNILHRDIKPENIIISKTGTLKLLDFGIAQDLSWQPPSGISEGTVNYMPPEQFEGKSCIASDVWALGVILYIFSTNAVPYVQQNDPYPMDIETNIEITLPRKINLNIDIELERIIIKCLQKDLQKRYQDALELQDDLLTTFPQFGKGEILPG